MIEMGVISGGSKERARDAPPAFLDQNFFIFMQFSGKLVKKYVGATSLGLAPPPLENPGSATGNNLERR